jgi:hypothetical protein
MNNTSAFPLLLPTELRVLVTKDTQWSPFFVTPKGRLCVAFWSSVMNGLAVRVVKLPAA